MKTLIITLILSTLILYLGMSFIELTINFLEWHKVVRFLFFAILLIYNVLINGIKV